MKKQLVYAWVTLILSLGGTLSHAQTAPSSDWFKSRYTEVDSTLLANLSGTKWKLEYTVYRGIFATRLKPADFVYEVTFLDSTQMQFNSNGVSYACSYLRHFDGLGIQFNCGTEKGGYKIVKLTADYLVVNIRVMSKNGKSLKNTRKRFVLKRIRE